ncbi:Uncharacterised protein [Vibrio cholerae]|nr:Uncharacterised protein [Vibrio cholerae]
MSIVGLFIRDIYNNSLLWRQPSWEESCVFFNQNTDKAFK